MFVLPDKVTAAYNSFMAQQKIPANQQNYFRKWLRYYIDFCRKYKMSYVTHLSLNSFCNKLREKQQPDSLVQQAREAVELYYSMLGHHKQKSDPLLPTVKPQQQLAKNTAPAANCASDWSWIYAKLVEQIRIRHYSDKTLRSYRGWVRQLQSFVGSKDGTMLDVEDVKAFLSYLAVERKVSASSQNQAFNGLLFLFRHVLNKKFWGHHIYL